MINITELRVGNVVAHVPYGNKEGTLVTINGLLGMQAYFSKYTNESAMLHNLKGIPITGELLLYCGFKLTDKEEYEIGSFRLYISLFDYTTQCGKFFLANSHAIGMTYLHQLQNLYFATTGEELKIKL